MAGISRRCFLQGLAAVAALSGCQNPPRSDAKATVVVVGGGFGGATAAKTLRLLDDKIKVVLIEPKLRYMTCPGSNWMFAGLLGQEQLTVDYRALIGDYRIDLLSDRVDAIDRDKRRILLAGGLVVAYDRLILAPGIAFRWDAIEGYDRTAAENFPHAWQAGPQNLLLARQLHAMQDGGVVLIAAPPDPYRCPPGPYERASMMAHWLKQHKPRSKLIILDPKRGFSKQGLFEAAWAEHYGYGTDNSLIEWHSLADNPIVVLDKAGKTLISEFGDRFTGDVLNIIPPQMAAEIAHRAGLSDDGGWCRVKPATSQSVADEFIHVIGDAADYAPIPKSAFAANSEAKACAFAVAALLNDRPVGEPHWLNTCYSLVTPAHGISVAGVYKLDSEWSISAVKGAGGVSRAAEGMAEQEAVFARSAYRALVHDTFA